MCLVGEPFNSVEVSFSTFSLESSILQDVEKVYPDDVD